MQGKEAAVAKRLASSQRPLVLKHSAANSVNGQRQTEREATDVSPQEEEPSTSSAHLAQEPGKSRSLPAEQSDDGCADVTQHNRSLGFASLVADYSDSDSDSAQES